MYNVFTKMLPTYNDSKFHYLWYTLFYRPITNCYFPYPSFLFCVVIGGEVSHQLEAINICVSVLWRKEEFIAYHCCCYLFVVVVLVAVLFLDPCRVSVLQEANPPAESHRYSVQCCSMLWSFLTKSIKFLLDLFLPILLVKIPC